MERRDKKERRDLLDVNTNRGSKKLAKRLAKYRDVDKDSDLQDMDFLDLCELSKNMRSRATLMHRSEQALRRDENRKNFMERIDRLTRGYEGEFPIKSLAIKNDIILRIKRILNRGIPKTMDFSKRPRLNVFWGSLMDYLMVVKRWSAKLMEMTKNKPNVDTLITISRRILSLDKNYLDEGFFIGVYRDIYNALGKSVEVPLVVMSVHYIMVQRMRYLRDLQRYGPKYTPETEMPLADTSHDYKSKLRLVSEGVESNPGPFGLDDFDNYADPRLFAVISDGVFKLCSIFKRVVVGQCCNTPVQVIQPVAKVNWLSQRRLSVVIGSLSGVTVIYLLTAYRKHFEFKPSSDDVFLGTIVSDIDPECFHVHACSIETLGYRLDDNPLLPVNVNKVKHVSVKTDIGTETVATVTHSDVTDFRTVKSDPIHFPVVYDHIYLATYEVCRCGFVRRSRVIFKSKLVLANVIHNLERIYAMPFDDKLLNAKYYECLEMIYRMPKVSAQVASDTRYVASSIFENHRRTLNYLAPRRLPLKCAYGAILWAISRLMIFLQGLPLSPMIMVGHGVIVLAALYPTFISLTSTVYRKLDTYQDCTI